MSSAFELTNLAPLEAKAKLQMADLVLAFASLDCAIGILLSAMRGRPLDEGAEQIGKSPAMKKLKELKKFVAEHVTDKNVVATYAELEERYPEKSSGRNKICHAHCIGCIASDPNKVVFAVFEKHSDGQMPVDTIDISDMRSDAEWARELAGRLNRMSDILYREYGFDLFD